MAFGPAIPIASSRAPFARTKARNLEQLANDIAARRQVFHGLPEVVSLHTTEICNLRCVMCKRAISPGRRSLERSTLERVVEALFPTARLALVGGFLGEPMTTDLDCIVAAAARFGVKMDLVTNGTLLTADRYREIRGTLATVNVSMDSHVPEVYERIRVGASHARLLANLHAIREERRHRPDGVIFTLSAVVMRSNLAHLPAFVRFAAGLGVDAVHLQPLRQFDRRTPGEDPLSGIELDGVGDGGGGCPALWAADRGPSDAILRCEREVRAAALETGINLYFGDFCAPPVEPRRLRRSAAIPADNSELCWNVGRNFSVFPTGDVYPCCHPTDHVLGNVGRDDIGAIWNGPAAQRLRRAHFSGKGTAFCNGCLRAPYLQASRPSLLSTQLRRGRLAYASVRNALRRRLPLSRVSPITR